ncbi:MAG TPA: hypothetical protein VHX44_17725 [Planctomycetota bacterium]|nr:hypothetical protein [Planctomycetota bacterium]
MRLTCEPLSSPDSTSDLLVRDDQGRVACTLWTHVVRWRCKDAELAIQVIAPEAIDLPIAEASEPAPGALARLTQALMGSGGLLLLRNPALAFGAQRIAFSQGVRLFAIADAANEACWDAMLSLGQPVYGVRGIIACACRTAHPGAVISALAYGTFTCEEGLAVSVLDESRQGVKWTLPAAADTAVIVRDGFEAGRISGTTGEWQDRGSEGFVRLVMRSPVGTAWTQPRFIAPVVSKGGGCA